MLLAQEKVTIQSRVSSGCVLFLHQSWKSHKSNHHKSWTVYKFVYSPVWKIFAAFLPPQQPSNFCLQSLIVIHSTTLTAKPWIMTLVVGRAQPNKICAALCLSFETDGFSTSSVQREMTWCLASHIGQILLSLQKTSIHCSPKKANSLEVL